MEKLSHALIGISGIGGIQLLDVIPTDPTSISDILKIVGQLVIGIVTLWKMLKKNSEKTQP
jgi:hypothetical protein